MRALRGQYVSAFSTLALMMSCIAPAPPLCAADHASRGQIQNSAEVRHEIQVAAGTEPAVKDYFPSFLDYQDLVLFHPQFGYYSSGRVSFSADYQTYPTVLAPYFGQMIAEQIYRMWNGMRQAGTLGPREQFTIAEFGAGDGALAEQILNYLAQKPGGGTRWSEFAAQVVYICYDRSPALSLLQNARNSRFGKQFEAHEADATNPAATIGPASLKGVVLSNELPDAFSVHKVILSTSGAAEVAFVVPSLSTKAWNKVKKSVSPTVADLVRQSDQEIQKKFFTRKTRDTTYLSRAAWIALLESLVSARDYAAVVRLLEFHEVYISAHAVPELASHLHRYAHFYAGEIARNNRGAVTYVNLGAEKFVRGAGRILGAGYVMTIDYGANWDGIMKRDVSHLRTYGPTHQEENDQGLNLTEGDDPDDRVTSDPYKGPTLNDITTDVNFSVMAAEGQQSGLSTVYFGRQHALVAGTPISLNVTPPERREDSSLIAEYQSWLETFRNSDDFKLLVQQKTNTDAAYIYPDKEPEPLAVTETDLTPAQRETAAAIERMLTHLE
jgi:SAM-dependent MidA family methyltransferase